jgi:hypothetical protein
MIKKIINIFLTFLVFTYIIFEELIWDRLAKPIFSYISNLELFKDLEPKILALNSYLILFIFLIPFIIVEFLGIYAGILFVSGKILLGIVLYISKIPIAVVIFWFFNIAKDILLQFRWLNFIYKNLISIIDKIKHSKIYLMIQDKTSMIKDEIKKRFFTSKIDFKQNLIEIYKLLKDKFNKRS